MLSDTAVAALIAERDHLRDQLTEAEAKLSAFLRPWMTIAFAKAFKMPMSQAALVASLYRAQGRVVRRESLDLVVRASPAENYETDIFNLVKVRASQVRTNLKRRGCQPPVIECAYGVGYRLPIDTLQWLEPFAKAERDHAERVAEMSDHDFALITARKLESMTPRERVRRLILRAAIAHDVAYDDIIGKSQNAAARTARRDVWRTLRFEYGWTYTRIARLFGRDDATIWNALHTAEKEPPRAA
jgi:DNA-binding winged helix-turn-helix (wHTH) protein